MAAITCQECGATTHAIAVHLSKEHPEMTLEDYKAKYPLAPTLSAEAQAQIDMKKGTATKSVTVAPTTAGPEKKTGALHELFGFPSTAKAAMNALGEAIKVSLCHRPEIEAHVPDADNKYVFDIADTKTVMMALEMNIPILMWGHSGVGKSSLFEECAARTGRGYLRVQHTANTEEADIEGQWRVKNGEMVWEDGPLPFAMEHGLIYNADEYDFASPMVCSIYQAVLEGKPLRIKAANKVVKPHADFRFVATGNTNGSGDESGLYAGTQIQNAANYERFGIVMKKDYMEEKQEIALLMGKTTVAKEVAQKLVEFAKMMRNSFDRREVTNPLSPRSLQFAARLGLARSDYKYGITCAYINRLPPQSAAFATSVMQRMFG